MCAFRYPLGLLIEFTCASPIAVLFECLTVPAVLIIHVSVCCSDVYVIFTSAKEVMCLPLLVYLLAG